LKRNERGAGCSGAREQQLTGTIWEDIQHGMAGKNNHDVGIAGGALRRRGGVG
jgi:hypothetical protein